MLKVLYSNRAYSCLQEFVKIFEDLEKCGCKAPCDLPSLRAFAAASLVAEKVPDYAGELTDRMKFFGSVLYKNFVELRAAALESAAQKAKTDEEREKTKEINKK